MTSTMAYLHLLLSLLTHCIGDWVQGQGRGPWEDIWALLPPFVSRPQCHSLCVSPPCRPWVQSVLTHLPPCLGPWGRRSPSPVLEAAPTLVLVLICSDTNNSQEQLSEPSSMKTAEDPQGSQIDSLVPSLAA